MKAPPNSNTCGDNHGYDYTTYTYNFVTIEFDNPFMRGFLTGAKIAIHESERECVEHDKVMIPKGVNGKALTDRRITFVYPGHGKPFPVEVIKNHLKIKTERI
jgi:hypothetical protein